MQQITWFKIIELAYEILPHLPKQPSPKSLKVFILPILGDYSNFSLVLVCISIVKKFRYALTIISAEAGITPHLAKPYGPANIPNPMNPLIVLSVVWRRSVLG